MLDVKDTIEFLIVPTLKYIGLYSDAAVKLMIGTALVESNLTTLKQRPDGPALGLWQMEAPTYAYISMRIKQSRYGPLYDRIKHALNMADLPLDAEAMIGNLTLALIMARLKYYLDKRPIPDDGSIEGLAKYWAMVYNTKDQVSGIDRFTAEYYKYCGPT